MKRRAIAICLSLILTVTGIVAALPVMVNFASADTPSGYTGNFDELVAAARLDCPTASLSTFDSYTQYMYDVFDDTLIVVIHEENTQNWFFGCYSAQNPDYFDFWYASNDYNKIYIKRTGQISSTLVKVEYSFKLDGSLFRKNNSYSYSVDWLQGATISFDGTGYSYGPGKGIYEQSGMKVYFNRDIKWVSSRVYYDYLSANLLKTSPVPDPIEFHWFKFQLGQRWYVTTYDQSLVAAMETGDDTFWVWSFDKYLFSQEEPVTEIVTWHDMQYLPSAAQFIEQNVTNISSSGILAYDITDLVLSGDVIQLALSQFWQVIDSPGGMVLSHVLATSEDIISLVLTPDEENESQNNAWDNISDYMENYPSVTISPQALAEQVLGTRAYTGSMGVIQMPEVVYNWCHSNYPDQVSNLDYGNHAIDGYWHFRLDGSGIDSVSYTMINWSICNACIIPAPEDTWLNNTLGIDSYAFPVYWWNPSDQLISDASFLGTFPVDYILQMFDIVIFAPSEAVYLSDFGSNVHYPGTIGFCNLNYDSTIGPANGSAKQTVFICSTDKVLFKSQLFTFCDSQSKLYDLLSEYIQKRDLWDSSFLKWSLSVFWELETINGHLNNIETILGNWNFKDWFQDLSDKLSQIADNTSETQEPMWYESLWNWVRKFTPSDNAFTNGLNAIETGLDNIPDIALPTHYPDFPLLPTFTPTPVPIEGS